MQHFLGVVHSTFSERKIEHSGTSDCWKVPSNVQQTILSEEYDLLGILKGRSFTVTSVPMAIVDGTREINTVITF